MSKEPLRTYYLYHHQPDPLAPEEVQEQAWLVNNGVRYSVVAVIGAHTPEEAYQAVREKIAGHGKLSRFVTLRTGNLLRETLPGDVLVSEEAAWMITSDAQLQSIAYEISQPWKSYSHDATVECISWAPNGRHVATISKEVLLHNPFRDEKHAYPASYRRHSSTGYAIAWSPDGSRIASGGYNGEVHVWKPNPFGGYQQAAIGSILICRAEESTYTNDTITSIAWAPDSRSFFAGRKDGAIVQWDAITGERIKLFKPHQKALNVLAYSPDGLRLASASDDGTLRVWRSDEAPASHDLICQHSSAVSAFAWSPDSTLLVSACEKDDQSLHFWDALSGEPGERIPLSISFTRVLSILSVAWSPDGRYIAAGCDDGTLQVVDVLQRRHIRTYRMGSDQKRVCAVAWSPDGAYLTSGGSNQWGNRGLVRIWQVEAGGAAHQDDDLVPSADELV